DLNAIQEDLLLKLLSGWSDSRESNLVEVERNVPDPPEPKMAPVVKFPRLSLRERKAPCKKLLLEDVHYVLEIVVSVLFFFFIYGFVRLIKFVNNMTSPQWGIC
ncbi:unnamed protein product, partial [Staurois parvus]